MSRSVDPVDIAPRRDHLRIALLARWLESPYCSASRRGFEYGHLAPGCTHDSLHVGSSDRAVILVARGQEMNAIPSHGMRFQFATLCGAAGRAEPRRHAAGLYA